MLRLTTSLLVLLTALLSAVCPLHAQILLDYTAPTNSLTHSFLSIGDTNGQSSDSINIPYPNLTTSIHDNGSGTISLTVSAPAGQQFQIQPSDLAPGTLKFNAEFSNGTTTGTDIALTSTLSFTGASGTFAASTDKCDIFDNGQSATLGFQLSVPSTISFTSFTYIIQYDPSNVTEASALDLIGANLSYIATTGSSVDPGPLMTLQPAATPEPATWALLFLSLPLLAYSIRRCSRSNSP